MAHHRRSVPFFHIGIRTLPALHAVQKIPRVRRIQVVALHLHRVHRGRLLLAADDLLRRHLEAAARQRHHTLAAIYVQRHALRAFGDFARRPRHHHFGELIRHLLHIGCLAAIGQRVATAEARHHARRVRTRNPARDIQMVRAPIRHLAARVVPEPAEIVDAAEGVERPLGCGTKPHLVIETAAVAVCHLRRFESRKCIALHAALYAMHRPDAALLNQFHRRRVMRPGPLLAAGLHHALVFARRVQHPAPVGHGEREWLLAVHILARVAGRHGHQGVPVIGRAHNHRIDIFLLQQLAEIVETLRAAVGHRQALLQKRLVHVADRRRLEVRLFEKGPQILAPASAAADQPHAHPIVRAADPRGAQRR